jgi:hypothetical protein
MPRNLILAYLATWVIHGAYIIFLVRKNSRLGRK